MYSGEMIDSARRALATLVLVVSFDGASTVAAAAEPAPDAAHALRARRRWIVEGSAFEPSLVDPVRRRMYLFDGPARAPFAASTETGARLWTGAPLPAPPAPTSVPKVDSSPLDTLEANPRFLDLLPPAERRQLARRPRPGLTHTVLRRTDDTLLVDEARTLSAYDLATGQQLWSHELPCRLEETRGDFARLACQPLGTVTVIVARSGQTALSTRKSSPGDEAALGPHELLLLAKSAWTLSARRLDRAGASWSVALLPKETPAVRKAPGFAGELLVTDDVAIVLGEAVAGVELHTGRALWRFPPAGCDTAARLGPELGLVCADGLEVRDPATGQVRDFAPLPLPAAAHRRWALLGDGEHQLLVEGPQAVGPHDRILFRARRAYTWTILRRPSLAVAYGWDGRVLVAAGSYDGFLFGLDPASTAPSLAALPPAEAIAAIRDDAAAWDRFLVPDLLTVDGLGPALAAKLDHPDDPLYGEALAYLDEHPVPEALPVLERRLPRAETPGERRAILDAIAAQDSEAATHVLVDWLQDAPSGRDPLFGDRHDPLYRQVWRTGRTAATGLCGAGTRPVPELASPAPDGSVGTAHPLLFQTAAPDASWVGICQARHDTNHDGRISVVLGHHGEPLGDEMQPYLIEGSGTGLPVDDLLGHDPTGRYVAVRQGACLDLVDTQTRTATRLPDADLRESNPIFGPRRAVSFDGDGTRMLYIRGGLPRPQVVVRDLARGTETALDPGPGNLWHATLDPEGSWVMTESLTDGHWPVGGASPASRTCRGEPISTSTFRLEGATNPPRRRVIPAAGGAAQEVPGLVRPFGRDFLVRDPDGALSVVSSGGQRLRTIVPADCHARVEHVDGQRGVVIAACRLAEHGHRVLRLYGPSGVAVLGTDNTPEEIPLGDSWDDGRPRFARLFGGLLVDLDRRVLTLAPPLGPREARLPDWREERRGVYLLRGDHLELALTDDDAARTGQIPRGPLRWRAMAIDRERPFHPDEEAPIPVRDPKWGLVFEFGFGGGGTDLATVPYDGKTQTLSAGDGIHLSLGLMWTPLWWGDRLGAGLTGTVGYKGWGVGDTGSQATISRFPLTLAVHLLPRLSHNWLLLARAGIDQELAASASGGGANLDLSAKLGAFGEAGFYYIFDIWAAPEHRGEQRAALSVTLRYTKLTYTAQGATNLGDIDGSSLMVFTTYYYNP